ncbi:hypothetical protein BH24ACT3_BH24ACT3_09520 [soil metagenome]
MTASAAVSQPVTSPFTGFLMAVLAAPGELVRRG